MLKLGGSGSFFIRNGWEGDAFIEIFDIFLNFLKIGWEWVVFVEKWVRVCHFCQKMDGIGSLLLKNRWEWGFFFKNG